MPDVRDNVLDYCHWINDFYMFYFVHAHTKIKYF